MKEIKFKINNTDELKDIQKDIEGEDNSFIKYDIDSTPAFYTLEILAKYFDEKSKVFEIPEFQRHAIWDQKRKSKLIESFLMGLPVPSIFLFTENKSNFKVIDGVQRLNTVWEFLNPKKSFRLVGLGDSIYNGKDINDLSKMIYDDDTTVKDKLVNAVLPATIIRQLRPNDNDSMYEIFSRLNTGGMPLNNMEVRRCIAYGKLLTLLEDTNNHKVWSSIFGKSQKVMNKRFLDLELILRCFALYEYEYDTQMKEFLNKYVTKNKNKDKSNIADLFIKSVTKIVKIIGKPDPFTIKKTGRPNYALLDSTIVAVMKHIDKIPKDFSDRFNRLINSDEYKNIFAPGQGTMSPKIVNERLQKAEETLCL